MHSSGCPSLSWLLASNQLLLNLEVVVSSTCDYMLQVLLLATLTPLIHLLLYPYLDLDLLPCVSIFIEVGVRNNRMTFHNTSAWSNKITPSVTWSLWSLSDKFHILLLGATPHYVVVQMNLTTAFSFQENDTSPATLGVRHPISYPATQAIARTLWKSPSSSLHGKHSLLHLCLVQLVHINTWLMILLRPLGFGVPPPCTQGIRSNCTLGRDYFEAFL